MLVILTIVVLPIPLILLWAGSRGGLGALAWAPAAFGALVYAAVWLYFRFTMSYRDVEDLLAERGIEVSYETIRLWVLKFGRAYARRIRKCRGPAFNI